MNMRSLTGAEICVLPDHEIPRVTKSGGSADLFLQAEVMARAGSVVFPQLYGVSNTNGYTMERLQPQPAPLNFFGTAYRLFRVRDMLPLVWKWAPLDYIRAVRWQLETENWLTRSAPWLLPDFRRIYARKYCPECLIHGDPTLANVMLDDKLNLKLIDPAPPRFAVPQLPEVDLGKLLQSVAGWEHVLDPDWPEPQMDLIGDVVDDVVRIPSVLLTADLGPDIRGRAIFWGAFHCARIMVRYAQDPMLSGWGLRWSQRWLEMLK